MSERKIITSLYEHFKNTPKKLKIICDWDEVIQACEVYALSKAGEQMVNDASVNFTGKINFSKFFEGFWGNKLGNEAVVDYSPYGSKLKIIDGYKELEESQQTIKNSPDFYLQAPFLTMAEDLLKLIKEDKVERLIFLSTGDKRKYEVFRETFYKLNKKCEISLRLLSEEIKTDWQIRTKNDWIRKNAWDYDIFIDDNPNICRSLILEQSITCNNCFSRNLGVPPEGVGKLSCGECLQMNITVLAPYYPAVEGQHNPEVLLVKNEVSELKKEDFSK